MAVRRGASPSHSPAAGNRRKRSRSAAAERDLAVAQRRRETRRSSSTESPRELRRLAEAKATDASPEPAGPAAAASPTTKRPGRRRSLSPEAGGRRVDDEEGQRDDDKGRSPGRGRKDERSEEAPRRRESSDQETVQCNQCGSYCRGQSGLKMHQAYSKKCLAYGFWNKGTKPWDKCLTMANKAWQVRERKEKQGRGPKDDDRPTGNRRARQHDDESRPPREREKRKVSVPREGGRASPSREDDRRGRERSRHGRSERRRSRAAERSERTTVKLTEVTEKKDQDDKESSRRHDHRRAADVKHVKASKSAEVAKKNVPEKEKTKPATKPQVVPVNESEDEVEESSESSSYSYYTEASPQLSGTAPGPAPKAGLQPTSTGCLESCQGQRKGGASTGGKFVVGRTPAPGPWRRSDPREFRPHKPGGNDALVDAAAASPRWRRMTTLDLR